MREGKERYIEMVVVVLESDSISSKVCPKESWGEFIYTIPYKNQKKINGYNSWTTYIEEVDAVASVFTLKHQLRKWFRSSLLLCFEKLNH